MLQQETMKGMNSQLSQSEIWNKDYNIKIILDHSVSQDIQGQRQTEMNMYT